MASMAGGGGVADKLGILLASGVAARQAGLSGASFVEASTPCCGDRAVVTVPDVDCRAIAATTD